MSGSDLLAYLTAALATRGVELVADCDRLGVCPAGWLSATDLAILREHKATILRLLRRETATFATYNEWCWANVDEADRNYLMAPRVDPCPCPWCGGRLHHNPLCDDLRCSWEPAMPFGKHEGKPLGHVPRDYLCWLLGKDGIDAELRAAIHDELRHGIDFDCHVPSTATKRS